MLKKLSKTLTIVNSIIFAVVILIGGVSIFLTSEILHNGYKSKEISEHMPIVNDIYSDAYRLVLAMHHFLVYPEKIYSSEAALKIHTIEQKTIEYKKTEKEEGFAETSPEIKLLDEILDDIEGLKALPALFDEFLMSGVVNRDKVEELEQYAYHIEDTVKKINKIHIAKITGWEKESIIYMWIILFLYISFFTLGGTSVYFGHRILSKKIVKPIKDLAFATIEFSKGTFDKRVYTDSQTEIGMLYQSFNKMADRLQEHDKLLRKFNDELESKVNERTIELKMTNEELRSAQEALIRTEKVAAIGQIAAGVTHEIKNPLNSLSINIQMLMRELHEKFGPDSSAYESASLVSYEVRRINNILDEFIKYTRFPEPMFIENNMNTVIEEVIDLISENVANLGITVNLSLQEGLPLFNFDARQFKIVFMNLAQNAIRAMPKGGILEIKTETKNSKMLISVSDTGVGIPEKNINKILTPFFSTSEGGLGLGLSIVLKIIENHRGSILCKSKVGEGTVFEIIISFKRG